MNRSLLIAILFILPLHASAQSGTVVPDPTDESITTEADALRWLEQENATILLDRNERFVRTVVGLQTPWLENSSDETVLTEGAIRAWRLLAPAFGSDTGEAVQLLRVISGNQRVVVQLEVIAGGLEVIDSSINVTFDRSGQLRGLSGSAIQIANIGSITPTITSTEAYQILHSHRSVETQRFHENGEQRLVWFNRYDAMRLAWELHPRSLNITDSHIAWIDAHSGEMIAVENQARHENQANVYETNPGSNSELETIIVELPERTDDNDMINERIEALNCINLGEYVTYQGYEFLRCSTVHTTESDENGDFLYEPDPMAIDDQFGETHMFYHANRAFDFFTTLGLTSINDMPLAAIVNYQMAGALQGSDEDLVPFENAAFIPPGQSELYTGSSQGSLIFGQGDSIDFAYDGDVIYHEFGHAVVGSTSNLEFLVIDRQGISMAPGAMNEGYADYFSSALTNDSAVGDYAGSAYGSESSIRDLDNNATCPSILYGEVHQDSKHFSGALWEGRNEWIDLGNDSLAYDIAIFDAMISLQGDSTFDDAVAITVDVVGDLDETMGELLLTIFAQRNVQDCRRIIDITNDGHQFHMILSGESVGLEPFAPGPLQFLVTVPPNTGKIKLTYFFNGESNYGTMEHSWIVADRPLVFEVFRGNLDGNWDEILEVNDSGYNTVTYTGNFEGDYYFMAVGETGEQGQIMNLTADTTRIRPEDVGSDTGNDTDIEDTNVGNDTGSEESDAGNNDAENDTGSEESDAGNNDAENDDTSLTDSSTEEDSGSETTEGAYGSEGCSCSTTSSSNSWISLLFASFLIRKRRRTASIKKDSAK